MAVLSERNFQTFTRLQTYKLEPSSAMSADEDDDDAFQASFTTVRRRRESTAMARPMTPIYRDTTRNSSDDRSRSDNAGNSPADPVYTKYLQPRLDQDFWPQSASAACRTTQELLSDRRTSHESPFTDTVDNSGSVRS